ncbi:MAG: thioredoxin domain-containing protein [Kofleriaceae bacterium]|nr:thioredoxin domain-containing protein [Kofleriaceae bacterium]
MRPAVLALLVAASAATAVTLAAAPRAAARGYFDPAAVYAVPLGDAPRRGPDDAPVTIVEFSDFSCRYCNRARRTIDHLERRYAGKVRWVFRHLPLDYEDPMMAEASLAAAAQDRFWPMHDRLFAVRGHVDRAAVELIAQDLGLDMTRFRGDLDAHTYLPAVRADIEAAAALGVSGTPTFFVNGRPLRGAQPLSVFERVVDEELARAAEAVAAGTAPADLYAALTANGRAAADATDEDSYDRPALDPTSTYQVGLGLDGHATGPDDALVTIVEWSDFQCPYCGRNAPVVARALAEYPGQIRVVFRHLPLPMHPHAQLAAEAAVAAAAQGRFWDMHDRLFADQQHLTRADLERIAGDLGLDLDAFRAALDQHRYADAVADDAAAAAGLGIDGTPTLFINGTPIEGAPSWDQLKLTIEVKLSEAESLVAHGIEARDVYAVIMGAAKQVERGDPSRMPRAASTHKIELRQDDREAAVEAACRGRDGARAGEMAGRLKGAHRDAARATCEGYGIDLP